MSKWKINMKLVVLALASTVLLGCSKEIDYDTGLPYLTLADQGLTVDSIKRRGYLRCGVSTGIKGFSISDKAGNWTGIDADFCRAVAAAVLGDQGLIRYIPLTARDRFSALANREVDLLARNTTWTMNRDLSVGLRSAGINYFDGQGFLVQNQSNVKSLQDLHDTSICVQNGTTSQLNLADWFRRQNMNYHPVVFDNVEAALSAFSSGQCNVFTSDQSQLYAHRAKAKLINSATILPHVISKEPLGPMVRADDEQWFNIVKWTLNSLLAAEELGINQFNVAQMMQSDHPSVRRLLGVEGQFGMILGLESNWVATMIAQVGHYGEIFDRNLGEQTELNMARGLNALWINDGLMYPLPVR